MSELHTPGTALAAYVGNSYVDVHPRLKEGFNDFMEKEYSNRKCIIKFTPWDENCRLNHGWEGAYASLSEALKRGGWLVKVVDKDYETLATFILCSKQAPWWTKVQWFFTL